MRICDLRSMICDSSRRYGRLKICATANRFRAAHVLAGCAVAVSVFVVLFTIIGTVHAETFLLTGATVHTVSGATHSPGQVLVKDGKIAGVGVSLGATGVKTVDLKGLHLFPGLIVASSSLGLVEISAVRATLDTTEVGAYTPEVQAWVSVNPDSELLPVARANGISHFLAVPLGGVVSGQSGLLALSGWNHEDMTVKQPVALHITWPSMNISVGAEGRGGRRGGAGGSADEQARQRQKRIKELDDFFEEARAYGKARPGATDPNFSPAWEAMQPVVRGEIPVMIHADELRQIKAAVAWAGTQKLKIILSGGRDAWLVASRLAKEKIPVIYEHVFTQPVRDTDSYDAHFKAPSVLHRAGVRVVFNEGTGGRAASDARNLPYAAAQAAAFSLPADEALKGITLYPAEVLGVSERLGSIEVGKEGTLFAADEDILDLRANVKRMWIAGREVSLESRHTRLYQKYRNRPAAVK